MIRTLHFYISRDLAKVTALALIAFTLVVTVIAIIEPLRKHGLGGEQAIFLFVYTLPIMVSLTLPIAALFAATIVYGRFSQENELMACRASGIATLSLLWPAMTLGILVTVTSLSLSNYVAPEMAARVELLVKSNAKGLIHRELSSQGYLKRRENNVVIAADKVSTSGDGLALQGVTAVIGQPPESGRAADSSSRPAASTPHSEEVRLIAAKAAYVDFSKNEELGLEVVDKDKTYSKLSEGFVVITLVEPQVTLANGKNVFHEADQTVEEVPLQSQVKEDPQWYDWQELQNALNQPVKNREIRRPLIRIQRMLYWDMLTREIEAAIKAGKPYDRLSDKENTYVLRVGSIVSAARSMTLAGGVGADGKRQPVELLVLRRDGLPRQRIIADTARIDVSTPRWTTANDVPVVSVELRDNVQVLLNVGGDTSQAQKRASWTSGQLLLPPNIVASVTKITPEEVFSNIRSITPSQGLWKEVEAVRKESIGRLVGKIIGEMHSRLAYGGSCYLLVALGAALGLMYRGGHIISAFALCVAPALVVIVMIVMGKQMISKPEITQWHGIAAIWSGIAILLLANVVVYGRLVRK